MDRIHFPTPFHRLAELHARLRIWIVRSREAVRRSRETLPSTFQGAVEAFGWRVEGLQKWIASIFKCTGTGAAHVLKSSWYAALGLLFAVVWPFALTDTISTIAVGILVVLSLNAVAFTWYATTSRHLSYFRGLDIIAACFMSGCANITFLYIIPVLGAAGRRFSQHRWILLVNSFYERNAGRPLEAFQAIEYE